MSLANLAKEYKEFFVPRFEVVVGETRFTDASGVISDLSVGTTLDKADTFSFTLNNLYNVETNEFERVDWERLQGDERVEISLGYEDKFRKMLVGTVESAKPDFPAGGVPSIAVSGFGRLHELMEGKTDDTFKADSDTERIKDSEATQKLLARPKYTGLSSVVDETNLEFERIIQKKESDYAFLKKRAKRYNYEVFARDDTVYFREPQDERDPDFSLSYGESLLSFSVELNRSKDVKKVKVIGSNRRGRGKFKGEAEGDDPEGEETTLRETVESDAEAKQFAESEVERIRQSRVTGSGETVGIPDLVAGTMVEIGGLTPEFNGPYYLESADHRISTSGYTTSFSARLGKRGRR